MSASPASRFGIPLSGDFAIWDLTHDYTIDPAQFRSKGRSTPFDAWPVLGKCLLTVHGGKAIYISEDK
jgi:dihydroorotase